MAADERDCKGELHELDARKMEAIGRLAAGVAHQFNNYLTVIGAYSEQMVTEFQEGSRQHKGASAIKRASDRAVALTQTLLAFGQRQMLAPKELDLAELAEGSNAMLREVVGERAELLIERGDEPARTTVDPNQMRNVLRILVTNAVEAIEGTGHVTIRTGVQAGCAALSVSDDGCGMDEASLSHLFEPFFTTKKNRKGAGLGLATVYGIIKQSNGHVQVTSQPGQGTTVTCCLPLLRREVRQTTAEA